MGKMITLTAKDGFAMDAYLAEPAGKPKAGLVVIQEIFGVNAHIQAVADGYAKDGYLAIAPALFDRAEKNVNLGYVGAERQHGIDLMGKMNWETTANVDVPAAIAAVRKAGKVGVVGYCWGGTITWLAATRLGVDAAVCYYGGRIANYLGEKPACPVMMHFGTKDASIPMDTVEKIKAAQPGATYHIYAAGHGFNCDHRADYDAACAQQARERTLMFFAKHLG
ncbi:MAG: dienelactone hydrolase family protein [Alphaproteobacteria bacterium]|nr:dienelactone hydrolase family protein [Alphaproteobacteria bacterium]